MRHLFTDLRNGARSLLKRPTLLVVGALTLALGIGANTAVFSVVWGAWLKPLPYPDADRLVRISDRHESFEPGQGGSTLSVGNYVDMKEGNRTFATTTVFTFAVSTLGDEGERVTALYTEPTLMETLGITPVVGRDFAADDTEGGRTAILSHDFWTTRFAASRSVVGEEVVLFEQPWTIIGVAPEAFDFPREFDVIIPFRWNERQRNAHGGRSMHAMGRLRPGVSVDAARADLQGIYAGIAERYPEVHEGWTAWVSPFREWVVGRDHTVLQLMSAAAGLLLLIACVNVASLLLVRAESRKREVALRAALGAGRSRILTAFLGESLIIGMLGGALGVAVAVGGIDLLVSIFGDDLQRPSEIGLNRTTLAVALAMTLGTSLVVGLVPGMRIDVSHLTETLRQASGAVDRAGLALRRGLVVTEIVLAVVLVSGAGLLLNTMWRLTTADLGFEPRGAAAAYLDLPADRYAEPGAMAALYRTLQQSLEAHEEVEAVGAGDRVPPDGNITTNGVVAVGRPESSTDFVGIRQVTPGYFRAAGIELVAGEVFGWLPPAEAGTGPGGPEEVPVVLNRTLAESLFGADPAVGRLIEGEGGRQRVVGVVESVRQRGATEAAAPMIYFPWPAVPLQFASRPVLIVRAAGAGDEARTAAVTVLRSTLEGIDREIRFSSRPLGDGLGDLYAEQEFALSLLGVFAGLALLLGAVGIYGVISYTVARRTREVGVRMALGAARSRVVGMVMGRGMALAGVGVVIGLAVAGLLGRYLASLLYEISPVDALTYGAVAGLFLATAALACFVPARRASRVAPSEALRAE